LIALICDTLTLIVVSSGTLEVHAVEEVMDNAMKTTFHEMVEPQHALQNLADALPALGIVAAVLGIVKTMGSIDKPPSILGGMIGSALVGTFMGVLLAYGVVAPMAGRLKQVIDQDEMIFHAVKQVVIASLHGWPQPLVVEGARSGLGHAFRPGLSELLDAMRGR
jgi:chemotaxis protein MotA